ncbi:hypothetical protein Q8A73_007374 [Channa argus]|nr:hypothetical protein Q8A73_007374 [Channa argus]
MEEDIIEPPAESSCPSELLMKSNNSMGVPENFRGGDIDDGVKPAAGSSCSSGFSMQSNTSMGVPENFKGGSVLTDEGTFQRAAGQMTDDPLQSLLLYDCLGTARLLGEHCAVSLWI